MLYEDFSARDVGIGLPSLPGVVPTAVGARHAPPLGAPAPFPCISAAASFRYFTDSFHKRGEIQALIDSARSLLATRKSPPFRGPTRAMRARVAQPTSPRGRRHVRALARASPERVVDAYRFAPKRTVRRWPRFFLSSRGDRDLCRGVDNLELIGGPRSNSGCFIGRTYQKIDASKRLIKIVAVAAESAVIASAPSKLSDRFDGAGARPRRSVRSSEWRTSFPSVSDHPRAPPHAADHRARRFGDEHFFPGHDGGSRNERSPDGRRVRRVGRRLPGGARGRHGGTRASRVVAERRVGTSSTAISCARRARRGHALGATRTVGQERFSETAVDARRVGAGARASDARAMRPTDRGEAQRRRASAAAGDASGQVRLPLAPPKLG